MKKMDCTQGINALPHKLSIKYLPALCSTAAYGAKAISQRLGTAGLSGCSKPREDVQRYFNNKYLEQQEGSNTNQSNE